VTEGELRDAMVRKRNEALVAAEIEYRSRLSDANDMMREAGRAYDAAIAKAHADYRESRDALRQDETV
jgi:hypothetical protein